MGLCISTELSLCLSVSLSLSLTHTHTHTQTSAAFGEEEFSKKGSQLEILFLPTEAHFQLADLFGHDTYFHSFSDRPRVSLTAVFISEVLLLVYDSFSFL